MKLTSLLITLFAIPALIFAQDFEISNKSKWIEEIKFDSNIKTSDEGGSVRYFLLDYQDNVDKEESYTHLAFQVLNDEGVQNYSNVSVSFDPSYERLVFHELSIIRDGKRINKLSKSDFSTIRRENDMNRFLYDGSLTSYINLTDIRSDDIIEYSYSRIGYNPVFRGKYSSSFYQDFSVPVDAISIRIASSRPLYFKKLNDAVLLNKEGTEYSAVINPELIIYESNTPNWYNPYRTLFVSSSRDWSEIVDWAKPLYYLENKEVEGVSKTFNNEIDPGDDQSEKVINAIRFVQDEIRYLGFESGIKGYQPTKPEVVLQRRFGDCKDKSNLLVALLSGMGVEAYPMLVNSSKAHAIDDEQPSITSFDHCVVNFSFEDNEYYVDPTINNQGGNLDALQFPNYKRGLIIKDGETKLRKFEETSLFKQRIKETILVKDLLEGGQAELEIESRYFGSSADYIRNYFDNSNSAQISKEYTSFYSSLYRDIVSLENVRMVDDNRESTNEVVVYEKYLIENFWTENSTGGILAEAYPLVIEGLLGQKVPAQRIMPYSLSEPIDVQEEIVFIMPEDWNVSESQVDISGEGFTYSSEATGDGNEVKILYSYEIDKSFIEAEYASDYLKKREEILKDLSFNLTYNPSGKGFRINWSILVLSVLTVIISVFIAVKLNTNFNPVVETVFSDMKIGGWLVLLAIGLSISPIRIAIGIYELNDYFDQNTWDSVKSYYGEEVFSSLKILIIGEIVLNIVFLIFSVLTVVLFFYRRTSAPVLISVFLISNLIFVSTDAYFVSSILEDIDFQDSIAEIARNAIFTIIWVLYLNMSDRSKNTFIKTFEG